MKKEEKERRRKRREERWARLEQIRASKVDPDSGRVDWDPSDAEQLIPYERIWRDHQMFFEQHGYMLRPRYRPGWIASWHGKGVFGIHTQDYEDGQYLHAKATMDATRISDGALMSIKKIDTLQSSTEIEIGRMFSSGPLSSEPRNHCVPILDVLKSPHNENISFIAMPFLRPYNSPEFETIGECVDFFSQIIEGILFMHEHRVAHRDCCDGNVLMDAGAMYPDSFHPMKLNRNRDFKGKARHFSRTERPPRYYWIDFGLSVVYGASEIPLELPVFGRDKSVPEYKQSYDTPVDPFPVDVYYVGNLIKEEFLEKYHGLAFMEHLIAKMTAKEPTQRPTMAEVASQLQSIVDSMGTMQLRGRAVRRDEFAFARWWRNTRHLIRLADQVFKGHKPIPSALPTHESSTTM